MRFNEELALVGELELTDSELEAVSGGHHWPPPWWWWYYHHRDYDNYNPYGYGYGYGDFGFFSDPYRYGRRDRFDFDRRDRDRRDGNDKDK